MVILDDLLFVNSCVIFWRRRELAETPPAMMMDFGLWILADFRRFSARMETAVSSKEAAKSAICFLVR